MRKLPDALDDPTSRQSAPNLPTNHRLQVDGLLGDDATGLGQMCYLVLAREDMMNKVEGRALTKKTTVVVCKFLIEHVI